ncbi:hypothetical protein FIBSPDRAFT_1054203 [Athelia psychrophila]|uniref:DUF6534 domain-containing protein n=1 Tax=Athelia psychrophila TaxID=1759441 RepID=A0A167VPM2_9AGAM|nr:hypothetical protein FIBSPDRAFT_1054203 [Fibularhizoctonia sp. CBS 109695]
MAKNIAEIALGPMLIGTVLDILLYGIMIAQVHTYFATFPKDRKWFKCLVLFLLVADTANVVFDVVYVYRSLILHFGDAPYLMKADWVFATDPVMTGIIASSVQFFFAWRIKVITNSTLATIFVALGSLTGLLASIGTSVAIGIVPNFVDFIKFEVIVIVWLVAAVVTDVSIAIALTYYLKSKTGFSSASNDIVNKIIRLTVQTGAITAIWATIDLIVYLTDNTGTHLIFNVPLSKLYSNSLMSSLNTRKGWNLGGTDGASSSGLASGGLASGGLVSGNGLTRGTSNANFSSTNGKQEIFVKIDCHELLDIEGPDHKYRSAETIV